MQIQLTPQEDNEDGALNADTLTDDPEQMKQILRAMVNGQIRQVKKNDRLRNWLLDLGEEAAARGLI